MSDEQQRLKQNQQPFSSESPQLGSHEGHQESHLSPATQSTSLRATRLRGKPGSPDWVRSVQATHYACRVNQCTKLKRSRSEECQISEDVKKGKKVVVFIFITTSIQANQVLEVPLRQKNVPQERQRKMSSTKSAQKRSLVFFTLSLFCCLRASAATNTPENQKNTVSVQVYSPPARARACVCVYLWWSLCTLYYLYYSIPIATLSPPE